MIVALKPADPALQSTRKDLDLVVDRELAPGQRSGDDGSKPLDGEDPVDGQPEDALDGFRRDLLGLP